MGNKLGKMVKKILLIVVSIFFMDLNSKEIENPDKFKIYEKLSVDGQAKIYKFTGSNKDISLNKIIIGNPSIQSLQRYKRVSKRDKFALKVLNSEGKEILFLGLGDPFYIHAQHIDYEDRDKFGGYIEADLDIALPIDIEPAYFVLVKKDEIGFKEIERIYIK